MHVLWGSLALVVCVALAALAVSALWRAAGEQRLVVTVASLLAIFSLVPERLGRLTGSIALGTVLTTIVLVLVAALLGRTRAHCQGAALRAGTDVERARRWQPSWRRAAFAMGAALALIALTTWLWDERSTHLPLASALARGVFPLEHPLFPGQPVHYHLGFPALGAVVRAFTALPTDVALDVVSLACIGGNVLVLVELGSVLLKHRHGAAVTLVVALLGGGPLAAWLADGWGLALPGKALLPAAWVNGATFPPLPITNVFQHPQGLAWPIALSALLVVTTAPSRGRFVGAALLVLALAQAQTLVFAFAGLALVVVTVHQAVAARAEGAPWSRVVAGLLLRAAVCAAVLAGALAIGGILTAGAGALRWGRGHFGDDAVVVRNLLAFGLALLAPVVTTVALVWAPRRAPQLLSQAERAGRRGQLLVVLTALALAGFTLGNVATYAHSWDIVKALGLGVLFGNVLVAWLVCDGLWALWVARSERSAPRLVGALAVVVLVVSCFGGALWWLRHGVLAAPGPGGVREAGWTDDVWAFDVAFGPVLPPQARLVGRRQDLAWAGFLVPGTDWRNSRDTAALLLDRAHTDGLTRWASRALGSLDPVLFQRLQRSAPGFVPGQLPGRAPPPPPPVFVVLSAAEERLAPPALRADLADPARFTPVVPDPRAPAAARARFSVWQVRLP